MRKYRPEQPSSVPVHTVNPTERLYSYEQVRSWCETMLDNRLKYLSLQINENNETIRQLKQRLLQNDRELERKQRLIQSLQKSSGGTIVPVSHPIDLSRKLLSSQLQDKLATINSLTRELELFRGTISGSSQQTLTTYQNKMDSWLNENLNTLKEYIQKKCALVKQHNSQYWLKIRKWAVVFEQRLKRVDDSVMVLGEEADKINVSQEMFGLYRIRNINARFKEIEEAVLDLEEGWRLAGETQEELREILWNNDERDFLEGEGEGVYVDYVPDLEFSNGNIQPIIQKKISESSPRKPVATVPISQVTSSKPAEKTIIKTAYSMQPHPSIRQQNQQHQQSSTQNNIVHNQVKKAVSTQSTRPMRQKPTIMHDYDLGTKSLVAVSQQSSRKEHDSTLLDRQTRATPKHQLPQQQPHQLPRIQKKTGTEIKYRTSPTEFKDLREFREVESEPYGEYYSPNYSGNMYRRVEESNVDEVVSSPKFGPVDTSRRVNHTQSAYEMIEKPIVNPKRQEPAVMSIQQESVSTFGKDYKKVMSKSSVSLKPEAPSSPKLPLPATVKNSIVLPPKEEVLEETMTLRSKTFSQRIFSWFGRGKSKDEKSVTASISVKPQPPASPQKPQPKVLPEPVVLPKVIEQPKTIKQIMAGSASKASPSSATTIKPTELSTSIKKQLQQQQSPRLLVTRPLSDISVPNNPNPLPDPFLQLLSPILQQPSTTSPLQDYQHLSVGPPIQHNDSFSSMEDNNQPRPMAKLPNFTTVEDVRERLQKLVETDKLAMPIQAYLDDFKFLKTIGDLYLFDIGGDMIRMSEYIYKQLCKEGILTTMKGH